MIDRSTADAGPYTSSVDRNLLQPLRIPDQPGAPVARAALAAATACLLLTSACRRSGATAADVTVVWSLTPAPPLAGSSSTLTLRLRDAAQRPVRGAALGIEAFMSHPGMAPVSATASESGDGVYTAPLTFTMSGDWILLVKGTLADGRILTHRIDVSTGRSG
jgi:hypothetical protein